MAALKIKFNVISFTAEIRNFLHRMLLGNKKGQYFFAAEFKYNSFYCFVK